MDRENLAFHKTVIKKMMDADHCIADDETTNAEMVDYLKRKQHQLEYDLRSIKNYLLLLSDAVSEENPECYLCNKTGLVSCMDDIGRMYHPECLDKARY